jgi:peptidoglycan/LPS O-acetylase OafA/YrhL
MSKSSDMRLTALDALRGVAILLVIGIHYFNDRGVFSLYPYNDAFAGLLIFEYGFMGVELFFIISGFVIVMTLERCRTPYEFFVRRFSRIWPPLLICSIITFCIVKASSSPFSELKKQDWPNFLPSLTLTPNGLWSGYFPGIDLVDGVYWSLLVEARFYVIVAVIFWLFKRSNVTRNLVIFTYVNILCRAALQRIFPGSNHIYSLFLVPDFMPWFAAGAVFFELWINRVSARFALILLGSMILIIFRTSTFVGDSGQSPYIISSFAIVFFGAFWLIATRSSFARFLETPVLVWIGICSYSVYLLHHEIGMVILTSIPKTVPIALQFVCIISVAAVMVLAGRISFTFIEQPARRLVTSFLLGNSTKASPIRMGPSDRI